MNANNQAHGEEINKQMKQALMVTAAIAEAIRELGSVPSGHLYARVMSKVSLEAYEGAIGLLKKAQLVTESNDLLTWAGPKF